MSFAIRCPSCGAQLNATEKLVGKRVPCPKCKQPLFVQQPATDQVAKQSGQPTPQTQYSAPQSTQAHRATRQPNKALPVVLILVGVGGLVLVAGIVGVAIWALLPQEPKNDAPTRGEVATGPGPTVTTPPEPSGPQEPESTSTTTQTEADVSTPEVDTTQTEVGGPDAPPAIDDSTNPLIDELRQVIARMIEELDTGLNESQIAALADARTQECINALRGFYSAFPNPAKEEEPLSQEFYQAATECRLSEFPISHYLRTPDRAGRLTPIRERLLAELIKASFANKYAAATSHEVNRLALEEVRPIVFPEFQIPDDSAQADDEEMLRANSRKLIMGFHESLDTIRNFPGADRRKKGEPIGLSWRVHVLPFVGFQALYDQFKTDEPWDSEHNMQMVSRMPDIFAVPWVSEPGMTSYHVLTGTHGAFGGENPPDERTFRDGMANTLAFVVAGPETAVPWTQPGGIEVNVDSTVKALGAPMFRQGFLVTYADMPQRFLPGDIPPNLFLAVAGPNDGIRANVDDLTGAADLAAAFVWPLGKRDQPLRLDEKLSELGRAMHRYHDVHKRFPDANDETKLSWRVALLPYLGEQELYDRFNHDEPWDSPHNSELLDLVPGVFPQSSDQPSHALVHVFTDEGTPFGGTTGPSLSSINDGPANVVMIVLGTESNATEWTKPGGLTTPTDSDFRESIGTVERKGFVLVTFDGVLKVVNSSFLAVDQFNSLIRADDGTNIPENMMVPWSEVR